MNASPAGPEIRFCPFELYKLESHLQLAAPPFSRPVDAFRQLRYVEKYAAELKCQGLVIESHYIDRDYIEDHSAFYSKSLIPYTNYCRRVHFFRNSPSEVEKRLNRIVEIGIGEGESRYREECRSFSRDAYLGFSVIKPLHGSPVGRTVLRHYPETPEEPDKAHRRDFSCTRLYTAHLCGVELTVRGLAFQQQDVGVSACATTAIWSALQKVRDHEDIAPATPAQITSLAARYSLPFGRAMPSEGLSLDQMCQAVQSLGVSPYVFRVDDYETARSYLYSATKSGIAAALMLKWGINGHAVAVVGAKLRKQHVVTPTQGDMDDVASDLLGVYVHDDRLGPYLSAALHPKEEAGKLLPRLLIKRQALPGVEELEESWALSHILIPMHSKIRLSLPGLRHAAIHAVQTVHKYREFVESIKPGSIPKSTVSFENWIVRAHRYVESCIFGQPATKVDSVRSLCNEVSMARYLGVVRLSGAYFDSLDLLVDTTGTRRNAYCLGIVGLANTSQHTELLAKYLGKAYKCPVIV